MNNEKGGRVTYENISYGMLVHVFDENMAGYHEGVKVHFFNRKGVLVGNLYEFVPYERLRLRRPNKYGDRQYQRFFYGRKAESVLAGLFRLALKLTSLLIRFTQKHMD